MAQVLSEAFSHLHQKYYALAEAKLAVWCSKDSPVDHRLRRASYGMGIASEELLPARMQGA